MSELGRRAASFGHAFRGVARLVASEANARIHLSIAAAVVALGWLLGLPKGDWALLLLAIAAVLAAEAFNSALETLADRVTREPDEAIGHAKDLAAGAVLFTALGAAGVGLLVLGPPLLRLLAG